SSWNQQTFELDFADFVEAEPGQWAPRSIRIECKDQFTCEYRFQLVAGTHWMLKEVVSWFKPEEKSRGVVEAVRINGDRQRLDEALGQVQATRRLFSGAGEPRQQIGVATMPFVVGRPMRIGPYDIQVGIDDQYTVVVSVSTSDRSAPSTVPL